MPVWYSGDVPTNLNINGYNSVRLNLSKTAFEEKRLDSKTFSVTYTNPTVTGVVLMRAYQAMTFTNVAGVTFGSSTPRIWFNIEKRSSPNSSGTNIFSSDYGVNSTGSATTTFNSASVAADDWLYIDVSEVTGTVTFANLTITLTTP